MAKVWDPLFGIPSSGTKIKNWNICVEIINDVPTIVRTFGYTNHKQTESKLEVPNGKNIGKKNETTALQQAINMAESMYKKQLSAGYTKTIPQPQTSLTRFTRIEFLPMLAHDYNKRKKDIEFPCYIQPKIDGVRMTSFIDTLGNIKLMSRTGKEIRGFDTIRKSLSTIFNKMENQGKNKIIDGELFTFDIPFEQISGSCRKEESETKELLEYHIFDLYDQDEPEMPFTKRMQIISDCVTSNQQITKCVIVETKIAKTVDTMLANLSKWIQDGYEGIMMRNTESVYKQNYRSKDLQKLKLFSDKEYVIVGGKEADGEDKGTVIFKCKNAEDKESFWVRPRGSREYRKNLLNDLDEHIGKQLTVRFQNMTEKGIPRFPVGVALRDYE